MPKPGRGQVLLKVRACGVCRTDLHILEGELPPHRSPVVPGHQIVAEVAALGDGADGLAPGGEAGAAPLRVGERVGVPWLHQTDQTLPLLPQRPREPVRARRSSPAGTWTAASPSTPLAPADFVYRLPAGMDDLAAAPLLCAGIIGYRCLRLVGIVGDGTGLPGEALLVEEPHRWPDWPPTDEGGEARQARRRSAWASTASARQPTSACRSRAGAAGRSTRSRAARSTAVWRSSWAPRWAGETSEDPGVLLDAAIIFAPAGELAVDALRRTDKGGIVALGGIYSTPIPPIEYPWIYDERVIRSVANSTRQDARELLRDAALIPVRSRVQVYDLEQANEALLDLKEDRVRGSAVLRVAGD